MFAEKIIYSTINILSMQIYLLTGYTFVVAKKNFKIN